MYKKSENIFFLTYVIGNLHNSGIFDKVKQLILRAPEPIFLVLNHLDWISLSGVLLNDPIDCTLPVTH